MNFLFNFKNFKCQRGSSDPSIERYFKGVFKYAYFKFPSFVNACEVRPTFIKFEKDD